MRARVAALLAGLFALGPLGAAPTARGEPAVADRVALEQPASGVVRVEVRRPGSHTVCAAKRSKPMIARYRGRLEVVQTANGRLAVINTLTFTEYLYGLAEVPRSWPEAALRAQAIAARSYALYQLRRPRPSGRAIGYDICSTDQCQVYRGVAIEQGAFGERWVAAVRGTEGRAILHRGEPIQAFYFSTSSGRTRSNEEVFGGAPLPYLPSVSGEDGDAPLARWTVRVPMSDLARILGAAGITVPAGLRSATRRGDTVTLTGSSSRTVSATAFRRALNAEAACAFPDRYPPRRADGSKLPQTVPSIRFSMTTSDGAAVLEGRGWGHDVGMSQYGAKALADRGRSEDEILRHYYGRGPEQYREPGAIRVLVAEGATTVRLMPENGGTLRPASGGEIGDAPAYEITPGDGRLTIARSTPQGAEPVLTITDVATTRGASGIERTFKVSGPARVTGIVSRGGREVARSPETSFERGEQRLTIPLAGSGSSAVEPGSYEVALEAFDGIDRVRLVSSFVVDPPDRAATRTGETGTATPWWPAAAAIALVVAVAIGAIVAVRRRPRQPNVNV